MQPRSDIFLPQGQTKDFIIHLPMPIFKSRDRARVTVAASAVASAGLLEDVRVGGNFICAIRVDPVEIKESSGAGELVAPVHGHGVVEEGGGQRVIPRSGRIV